MNTAYLLLGSNTGDRRFFLDQAILHIEQTIGLVCKKSSIYESSAWGFESKNSFLNQAIIVRTDYSPDEILGYIHKIENILGRVRKTGQYYDRTIDIDIIFLDEIVINKPDLIIPHPQLQKRKFSLIPLHEIIQDFVHPVLKKTINTLLHECVDNGSVNRLD